MNISGNKRTLIDLRDLPSTRREAQQTDSKFYFTADPCVNGHLVERRTSSGACVQCVRDASNAWHSKKRSEGGDWQEKRKEAKLAAQAKRVVEDYLWRERVNGLKKSINRNRYATDEEFRERQRAYARSYYQTRRENEEFEAFMARMEQEAAGWEASQADPSITTEGDRNA